MIAHADYIAVTNQEDCTHCMLCVERCVFHARSDNSGTMAYNPGACLGCGLCVSVCGPRATAIIPRNSPASCSEQPSASPGTL
jgi:heterodisulfide reductase subunit A-like polyferredoxin